MRSIDFLPNQHSLRREINPYLAPLAMFLTQDIFLKLYFDKPEILGTHHLPTKGPLILAPVHRARWDALILPHVTGRRITGRDCRFMVTHKEMKGIQGWFLKQLGCFPVNQRQPSLKSLRLAIDLLSVHEQLVIFPEGKICRVDKSIKIYNGISRLAIIANQSGIAVQIVPIGIGYSHPFPLPGGKTAICFGEPLQVSGRGPEAITKLNSILYSSLNSVESIARLAVGRPYIIK